MEWRCWVDGERERGDNQGTQEAPGLAATRGAFGVDHVARETMGVREPTGDTRLVLLASTPSLDDHTTPLYGPHLHPSCNSPKSNQEISALPLLIGP